VKIFDCTADHSPKGNGAPFATSAHASISSTISDIDPGPCAGEREYAGDAQPSEEKQILLRLHASVQRWELLHWIHEQCAVKVSAAQERTWGTVYKDAPTQEDCLSAEIRDTPSCDEERKADEDTQP
jgi:hypothetical protein